MGGLVDFRGRTALVTGAAGGIGFAICDALAGLGANVALTDCAADRLGAAMARIKARHPKRQFYAVAGDIGHEDGPDAIWTTAISQAAQIDVLVNNAGVGEPIARTVDQVPGDWQKVMDINLRGAFLLSRAFGRDFIARADTQPARGAIINIASVAGLAGVPASNAYAVSKAGMIHLTRTLASEWARRGLRVNAVAPGYVDTALAHRTFAELGVVRSSITKGIPMRRTGAPAEVARAVAFLASDAASYVSGVVLPVDGGLSGFGAR